LDLPYESDIGDFIQFHRSECGMSRYELADRCEISRTEIVRIEEGQRKQPSPNNLKKIAEVLHLSYMDMLLHAGYYPRDQHDFIQFNYPALKSAKQLETVSKLIQAISENPNLSDEDLDSLLRYADLVVLARKNSKEA